MAGAKIATGTTLIPGQLSGDAFGNIYTTLPLVLSQAGYSRSVYELDSGSITGLPDVLNPEIDVDYRIRTSQDTLLDEEVFTYVAQNTGKHSLATSTMNATFTAGQFTTNSGAITTIASGVTLATYATFPNLGTQTLSADCELAFSAQPTTNSFVEWGLGLPNTTTTAPSDGVFFRLSSAGLQGIASSNGTETSTGIFPLINNTGTWVYSSNKRYQFIIYIGGVEAVFWVNDGNGAVKLGQILLPLGQGRMNMASGLQFFYKHRITGGAAAGALQSFLGAYNIRIGGSNIISTMSTLGNRLYGSYQGQSGGVMGGLSSYVNSTNPTAAAPANASLTANLPAGLGGQGAVIAAVAAATEGIWASYQVPVASVSAAGRRLVLRGLKVDAVNTGAAVSATIATTIQFALAFGHTGVSLATTEGVASKAPRRLALGFMTWAPNATIGAQPQGGPIFLDLGDAPVMINPGEFIQLAGKFIVGAATAAQVIQFTWTPIYGWE